jgi:hypothetical protein
LIVGIPNYPISRLIRINPQNGNQSSITTWPANIGVPQDIAIDSNGQILVAGSGIEKIGDINYGTGAIYRVDPINGSYSIVFFRRRIGRSAYGNCFRFKR